MIDELFSQKLAFSQESILTGKCGGITIFKDFVKTQSLYHHVCWRTQNLVLD